MIELTHEGVQGQRPEAVLQVLKEQNPDMLDVFLWLTEQGIAGAREEVKKATESLQSARQAVSKEEVPDIMVRHAILDGIDKAQTALANIVAVMHETVLGDLV